MVIDSTIVGHRIAVTRAREIVESGTLDPKTVIMPGIFVDRLMVLR